MIEPKIDDLVIFAKVAEIQNFSKVASELGIVKSMISKRISRLEANLGVTLLNRSTRSMSLTEAGQTLYEYAARIEEEFSDAIQAIAVNTNKPVGRLRVTAPLSLGGDLLARLTSEFIQAYPTIDVKLILNAHLPDMIKKGIDLAIYVGEPNDSNLLARQLATRKLAVCASPQYFKRMGTPHAISDLYKHNCLIHSKLPQANVWHFIDNGRELKIKVKGNFISNSSQALKNAALNGLGIVMLPDYTLSDEVKAGKLVEIFTDHCAKHINIYGLYPYTKHIQPKLRVYIDFLANAMQK